MVISSDQQVLQEAFCRECRERILRARDILEHFGSGIDFQNSCDLLYQEFDSLHGGARAINFDGLEELFGIMRNFSRHIRQNLADTLQPEYRQLLEECFELSLSCGGNLGLCLNYDTARIEVIIDKLQQQINPG